MRVAIPVVGFWRACLTAWLLVALPAAASPLLVDDFETNHLGFDDLPAPGGQWDGYPVACAANGCTIGTETNSAHRGTFGMFFSDTHNTTGAGLQGEVFAGINIATAAVYGRFWFKATSSNGLGRAIIAQVADQGANEDSIMDLSFNPGIPSANTGTFEIGGTSNTGAYRNNAAPFTLTINRWYLIEFEVKGIGTATGSLRGYIDGELKVQVGLNLSTLAAGSITLGEPASGDRSFTGRFSFDDYRADTTPLASKWVLTPPNTLTGVGSCMPITATLINSIDGAPAVSPYTQVGGLGQTGSAGSFYSDPNCSVPTTSAALAINAQGTTFYFKPDEVGTATLSIGQVDFLTGTTSILIPGSSTGEGTGETPAPGSPTADGGTGAEANASDCPADNPFCTDDLKVGSSCGASGPGVISLLSFLTPALLLVAARRRAGRVP